MSADTITVRPLMTAREVAAVLGVGERTVWRLVSRAKAGAGAFPRPVRLGGQVGFIIIAGNIGQGIIIIIFIGWAVIVVGPVCLGVITGIAVKAVGHDNGEDLLAGRPFFRKGWITGYTGQFLVIFFEKFT